MSGCNPTPRTASENADPAFRAWLGRSLRGQFDPALTEAVPDALLSLLPSRD